MSTLSEHPYAKAIWQRLMSKFNNELGVAALMGNLQAESGLYPDRVQGDVPYSEYSKTYTARVDSGDISEYDFIHNAPNGGGYGLAQWTYYTRKQALYNKWKEGNYSSIGSVELACDYLCEELENDYSSIFNAIKNARNLRDTSDNVLHNFENPADQSTEVEELRASMGQAIYAEFTGVSGDEGGGGGTTTPSRKNRMSKLLLYACATDII